MGGKLGGAKVKCYSPDAKISPQRPIRPYDSGILAKIPRRLPILGSR